jgi:hypothetical protein
MTLTEFRDLLSQVTARLEGRALNSDLEALLNREFAGVVLAAAGSD